MEKQINITLEDAKNLLKIHRAEKKTTSTEFERAMLEQIAKTWSNEELMEKEGYTWEESFSGGGHYIYTDSSIQQASSGGVAESTPDNKNVFKTKEQAESALAFAQLSHIVSKYNEGKPTGMEAYSIQISNLRDGLLIVRTIQFGSDLPHMIFLTMNDAMTSMDVNKDLWMKFWMIKQTSDWNGK